MKTMKTITFAAALAACLPLSAWATGAADQISVVNPEVRLVPPSAMATAAYMVLKNSGDKDVKLVNAENSATKITELHTHINEDGMMKMRRVSDIEIKAKSETLLQPGGLHVMMIDINKPLKEGQKVTITLGFDDGSTKEVKATVKKESAAPMPTMDHSMHK